MLFANWGTYSDQITAFATVTGVVVTIAAALYAVHQAQKLVEKYERKKEASNLFGEITQHAHNFIDAVFDLAVTESESKQLDAKYLKHVQTVGVKTGIQNARDTGLIDKLNYFTDSKRQARNRKAVETGILESLRIRFLITFNNPAIPFSSKIEKLLNTNFKIDIGETPEQEKAAQDKFNKEINEIMQSITSEFGKFYDSMAKNNWQG